MKCIPTPISWKCFTFLSDITTPAPWEEIAATSSDLRSNILMSKSGTALWSLLDERKKRPTYPCNLFLSLWWWSWTAKDRPAMEPPMMRTLHGFIFLYLVEQPSSDKSFSRLRRRISPYQQTSKQASRNFIPFLKRTMHQLNEGKRDQQLLDNPQLIGPLARLTTTALDKLNEDKWNLTSPSK